ncbi:MAG: peptide-methionine (S)-S-oxide reductase, partial [Nitrosomonas sp.]|nr:peptide-methionine (S)-S-oxide reductase [Nitrosomonas sp.]
FCDRGASYRTAIFVSNTAEKALAEKAKAEAQAALGKKIVTPILNAGTFWPAEDYHQDYYLKNPANYAQYRNKCGRDARLKQLWGDEASTH